MTDDLAAEGDRLHAGQYMGAYVERQFEAWSRTNWPAIAAALRERDEAITARKALVDQLAPLLAERDALRVRAETAEAIAFYFEDPDCEDDGALGLYAAWYAAGGRAAHAAAAEARP